MNPVTFLMSNATSATNSRDRYTRKRQQGSRTLCPIYPAVIALAMALAAYCGSGGPNGYAQESHKSKVPGIDKITSGSSRLAFSGNVLSLDEKHELLTVNTVQGGTTEVFPVKKGVHVSAANGAKLKLDTLKPGTNVLVYYEQKAEKRSVTEIIVLSPDEGRGKNKPAPPS